MNTMLARRASKLTSVKNSAVLFGVIPVGTAFGHWISKLIALPQLRRLAVGEIPWTPLLKSPSESKVALVSAGGVHLRTDRPFNLNRGPGSDDGRSTGWTSFWMIRKVGYRPAADRAP